MNQSSQVKGKKKRWEKPLLLNLSVDATESGTGGTSVDFSNYDPTSPSATNTDAS